MRAATKAPLCLAFCLAALAGCGGGDSDDTPDGVGSLAAKELAALLPDGGMPQAVAVDVDAARAAAGLPEDADPLELGESPEELRFAYGAFVGMRDVTTGTDNPVRNALDHGAISAYAAHPYASDGAVTLVSTSQSFDAIASSLEDAGFERDGDVLTIDGSPEELAYTAIAPGDDFIALGFDAEAVAAVVAGEATPSGTGELEALERLEGPALLAVVPEEPKCVKAITTIDQVTGTGELGVVVDGEADLESFGPLDEASADSIGFSLEEPQVEGDTVSVGLQIDPDGSGLTNSPAVLVSSLLVSSAQTYDCR